MENEFDLFAQRKAEEADPLRLWFYSEILGKMLFEKFIEKITSNEA